MYLGFNFVENEVLVGGGFFSANPFEKMAFFQVHERIFLALNREEEAKKASEKIFRSQCVLVPIPVSSSSQAAPWLENSLHLPETLEEIYQFDSAWNAIINSNKGQNVVFVTGTRKSTRLSAIFLIGCSLIMKCDGDIVSEMVSRFLQSSICKETQWRSELSFESCWLAIAQAKRLRWITFQEPETLDMDCPPNIQMDEYLHYARLSIGHRMLYAKSLNTMY
jgi:hypothetical protein